MHRIRKVRVLAEVFWHFVTDGNCVAARRGGEQPEVNDQSVTQVNSIRPTVVASLPVNGEAQMTLLPGKGRVRSARGAVTRGKLEGKTKPNLRDDRGWLEAE